MGDPIGLGEFMRVNDLDPRAGLGAPMRRRKTSSVRDFVRLLTPVWNPTVRGLFRPDDIQHMLYGTADGIPADLFDLHDYIQTRDRARNILRVVSSHDDFVRMPKPPEPEWGPDRVGLFHRWVAGGMPR